MRPAQGQARVIVYFFLPEPKVGCQPAPAPFWLGAAAITLILSFLGFLASRLLLYSPLAMSISLDFVGDVGTGYPQPPTPWETR